MRKLRLHYSTVNWVQYATLETQDGYYLCTVERTIGEGKRRFRIRARALQEALERYLHPLVTLSPEFC